jgi:hypothetical protein
MDKLLISLGPLRHKKGPSFELSPAIQRVFDECSWRRALFREEVRARNGASCHARPRQALIENSSISYEKRSKQENFLHSKGGLQIPAWFMRSKGDLIPIMNSRRHSEHQSLILKRKDDMVWQLDNHGWTPHVIENMQMDIWWSCVPYAKLTIVVSEIKTNMISNLV